MALTLEQKKLVNSSILALEGTSKVFEMFRGQNPMSMLLDSVVDDLKKVLDEDGGAE